MARGSVRNTKIEWLIVLQIHMFVTAGLALVAVGVSSLFSSKSSPDSAMALLKAGFAIMFVGWGIIVGLCLWSFRRPASYGQVESTVFRNGTIVRFTPIIQHTGPPSNHVYIYSSSMQYSSLFLSSCYAPSTVPSTYLARRTPSALRLSRPTWQRMLL
jgi:hypothetical protein